jgi:SAM-dependent methyltransferase
VHRRELAAGVKGAIKRRERLHGAARTVRAALGRFVPSRSFPGLPGRVHFNDFMLDDRSPEGVASYRERALNVIEQIEAALSESGRSYDDVQSWLDFGCGYGRVVRFLVERVPSQRVTACDVVHEAVNFCASEFGVRPVYSTPSLRGLRLGTFDFVYSISVLTHLNERNSRTLLGMFGESLAPGGIVLFTTHGQWSLDHPETYGPEYVARRREISRETRTRGAFFLSYPYLGGDDYGMAWHTREYVEQTMLELHGEEVGLLLFEPQGLDGHQDVFAFRRRPASAP